MTQELKPGEVEALPYGVKMIVKQGNLDHWFNSNLWGVSPSSIRPAPRAFDLAVDQGLLEIHHGGCKFRLTDAGRTARRELERLGGSPAGYETLRDAAPIGVARQEL